MRSISFIYLLLIALAELLIGYYRVGAGLALHIIILFALFAHAAFSQRVDKEKANLIMAMALAPLIRIVSLYAPLSTFHFVQWFMILSFPLLCGAFLLIFFQHLSAQAVGLVFKLKKLHLQAAIASTGILFGVVEYSILSPQPLIPELSFRSLAAPILIMLVYTGFLEELIFRGIIQHNAITYFNPGIGIFFVALLFAVMHIGNMSFLDVVLKAVMLVEVFFKTIYASS